MSLPTEHGRSNAEKPTYAAVTVVGILILVLATAMVYRRHATWFEMALDMLLALMGIGWRMLQRERLKLQPTKEFVFGGRELIFILPFLLVAFVFMVAAAYPWKHTSIFGSADDWFQTFLGLFSTYAGLIRQKKDAPPTLLVERP